MSRSAPPPSPPEGFRGTFLTGDAAASAASHVSGPFRARPAAFATPVDREDLACLLEWAATEGLPLVPRGGGTGMPGGNLGDPLVISLGEAPGFAEVRWIEGTDCVRTGAGAVAQAVEAAAAQRRRFLPPLPSSARWCTAGGMAANNAAGARSFRFGAAAEWIEALEGFDAAGIPFRLERGGGATAGGRESFEPARLRSVVGLARGTAPSGWPRVRKNSSGYALDRFSRTGDALDLLVGSEGTLAVLTAVEWRTAPLPEARGLALLPAGSAADLARLAGCARRVDAFACEFLGDRFLELAGLRNRPGPVGEVARGAHALVFIEVAGSPGEVHDALDQVAAAGSEVAGRGIAATTLDEMKALWALRHAASPIIAQEAGRGRVSTQFIEDSVVPIESLADYLAGLDEALVEARFEAVVFGHAGDGNVHVNPLVEVSAPDWEPRVRQALDRVADLVAGLGGTLAGEHGDGRLRAPFLERVWGAHLAHAFGRLKRHFDPEGRLNPGVVIPRSGQDPLEGFAPRPRAFPDAADRA